MQICLDRIKFIGDYAFTGCDNLTAVTLPGSLRCNINCIFGYGSSKLPELLFYDVRRCKRLDDGILASIVRGYFYRLERNEVGEAELCGFIEFVRERIFRLFDIFDGYAPFYKFAIDYCDLPLSLGNAILEKTKSLECRAVLLQYKNSYK